MMRTAAPLVAALLAAAMQASAATFVLPVADAPRVGIAPAPNAALPLDAPLVDESGRQVLLGDYFDARRVSVVVFAWYRCDNLCATVMRGTLEALARGAVPPGDVRIVEIGIDPAETPDDARRSLERDRNFARAAFAAAAIPELHALTGSAASVGRIADAAGFRFARAGADGDAIVHAAGFLVAGADGRVSRWFTGVVHDPGVLRDALGAARRGSAMNGIVDRLVLLCSHFDAATTPGRKSGAVLMAVRSVAVASLAGLAWAVWRQRRRRLGGAGANPAPRQRP